MIPTSWYSCTWVILSVWVWLGLRTHFWWIKYGRSDDTSVTRLPKGCDCQHSPFCWHSLLSSCLLAAMLYHVLWRDPRGKEPREGSNSLQETEASVQQPLRSWALPTTMWVSAEANLSQLSLGMTAALWEIQSQRTQLICPRFLAYRLK